MIRENILGFDSMSRLQVILEDWAAWQARYSGIKAQSRSPCLSSGYESSKTFEDMLDAVENTVAQSVEAAIDDLQPGERAAINRRYGITAVFRFPRGNYEELLLMAHEKLLITLPKKGIVI